MGAGLPPGLGERGPGGGTPVSGRGKGSNGSGLETWLCPRRQPG